MESAGPPSTRGLSRKHAVDCPSTTRTAWYIIAVHRDPFVVAVHPSARAIAEEELCLCAGRHLRAVGALVASEALRSGLRRAGGFRPRSQRLERRRRHRYPLPILVESEYTKRKKRVSSARTRPTHEAPACVFHQYPQRMRCTSGRLYFFQSALCSQLQRHGSHSGGATPTVQTSLINRCAIDQGRLLLDKWGSPCSLT